ncbi:MAG: diacylglycerol/lipid kinase family protein [Egibacteraceae bacterium]
MRALLVYNPLATVTTAAVADIVTKALAVDLRLDAEATQRRGHASELAARAANNGYEIVIALGGDGTVNEAMQGVAGTQVRLAIIPGGSTNVLARTLGLPNDPIKAASVVLRKLRERKDRRINLGVANDRYFGFCAGWGYDALVVRLVEQRPRMKRAVRQAAFLWCGLLALLRSRNDRVTIALEAENTPTQEALRAIVCGNSNPYTFLGPVPARMCPQANLELGLDVTGLTTLGYLAIARVMVRTLTGDQVGQLGHVRLWHDHRSYEAQANGPLHLHVDGEPMGETNHLSLRSAPRALSVIA